MKRHIPNLITLANLLAGFLALLLLFQGFSTELASLCVLAGLCFDFLDGWAARKLGVASPMGKELDSLADILSFGAVPGLLLFVLIRQSSFFFLPTLPDLVEAAAYIASGFTVAAAAWRLAKFNTDERQKTRFLGIPTPLHALSVIALPLIAWQYSLSLSDFPSEALLVLALFNAWAMTAEIPLLALKFEHYAWKGNESRFLLAGFSALALLFFGFLALPFIFLAYIASSLFPFEHP